MSFKFFVILAVCWLMIFDEQLCIKAYIPPISLPQCLPFHDYHEVGPYGSYKLHIKPTTWTDAFAICKAEGAHLAVTDNWNEVSVLSTMLSLMGYVPDAALQQTAFQGQHYLIGQAKWVTVLNDPVDAACYVSCASTSNPSKIEKHCSTVHSNNTLGAASCDCKLPFFCEKPYPLPREKCC